MAKSRHQAEFGDFQTPRALTDQVCSLLQRGERRPLGLIEPTCGEGNFLLSALDHFPCVTAALGADIDTNYLDRLRRQLDRRPRNQQVSIIRGSFFTTDWPTLLASIPDPLLVLGNPPWITNAELGTLNSSNLPVKSNFQHHAGLDAITGKSNFDISQWMLMQVLQWLDGRVATMAMLCKTAVARKVLQHAWTQDMHLAAAAMYGIDAVSQFGANVDACLLVCDFHPRCCSKTAAVYPGLESSQESTVLGWRDGQVVASTAAYDKWQHLAAPSGRSEFRWRSGVKHDCAKVMELRDENGALYNRLGESVCIEPTYIYPMRKSSEVSRAQEGGPRNWMIVTQSALHAETDLIRHRAPQTWNYLLSHAHLLDGRRSSIYRRRPRFSVFGVGEYTFAPYKVAISGFYKRLHFAVVGPHRGLPVVFDDTVYFISCRLREHAELLAELLNSEIAREFYGAYLFWDAKRPVTADVLRRLDLRRLAEALGRRSQFEAIFDDNGRVSDRALALGPTAPPA